MNNLYLPAEWERQRALQLTWPHKDTDWNYCLDEINNTYVEMADAITRYEPLIIVAPDTKEVERMLCGRLSEEQMKRVTLHQCPTNDTYYLLDGTSRVVKFDIELSNGYLHIVDRVIAPSNEMVPDLIKTADNMNTILQIQ